MSPPADTSDYLQRAHQLIIAESAAVRSVLQTLDQKATKQDCSGSGMVAISQPISANDCPTKGDMSYCEMPAVAVLQMNGEVVPILCTIGASS